jgi:hypothetical protein
MSGSTYGIAPRGYPFHYYISHNHIIYHIVTITPVNDGLEMMDMGDEKNKVDVQTILSIMHYYRLLVVEHCLHATAQVDCPQLMGVRNPLS